MEKKYATPGEAMIKKKLREFQNSLTQELFFEAHEILEELWFPRRFETDNEVKLLKGFINAAVSFELAKRERLVQSKRVWKNYLKYRQHLFKIKSPYLNNYYQLSRTIESIQKELH